MNTLIASGPVIIENGKVLLIRDTKDSFWKFPGGTVEESDFEKVESVLEHVAIREAKEEIGCDIHILSPLRPILIKSEEKIILLIHWLAERSGEIHTGHDIVEAVWHDTYHLPENCAPNVKPVLEVYRSQNLL